LSAYTEDTLIQQTNVEHWEQRLGSNLVLFWNGEGFGKDNVMDCGSARRLYE
jgi:hypothetical protein